MLICAKMDEEIQNDYPFHEGVSGVLANQISFSKNHSYELKHKNAI